MISLVLGSLHTFPLDYTIQNLFTIIEGLRSIPHHKAAQLKDYQTMLIGLCNQNPNMNLQDLHSCAKICDNQALKERVFLQTNSAPILRPEHLTIAYEIFREGETMQAFLTRCAMSMRYLPVEDQSWKIAIRQLEAKKDLKATRMVETLKAEVRRTKLAT